MTHVLVLGDQLTRTVGPLASADPEATTVLMIESRALADRLPHHKQKLVLVFSAMRHFARSLEDDGFRVDYRKAPDFAQGIQDHLKESGAEELVVIRPTDFGYEDMIREAVEDGGGSARVVPNELWLTSDEDFDGWAEGRKAIRLEYFYRQMRKSRGWLMEDGEPTGGQWNYDADNRETPPEDYEVRPPKEFPPDELTREVIEEVEANWPDHFGSTEDFSWPVTREDSLALLDDFLAHRLRDFGPYEDAIVEDEPVLNHSLLSVPLNLGLLHPEEVCERALEWAADPDHDIPLQSIEGFVRQVLGWREFMRHVYRHGMPGLREDNGLGQDAPLPDLYWGDDTDMRCLSRTVALVKQRGHTHHIQRLMVLGNFALIAGVDPRELNDWFLACYVDALDWVVTSNVMGMSQFANLGAFTSKPYAASGNYVNRMSDHCAQCRFDPNETVGDDACPLNALYWDFIHRHRERWASNHRMGLMMSNWDRRKPETREKILARAREVLETLGKNEL